MYADDLKSFGLFKSCTDSFFGKLESQAQLHSFGKGKLMFVHGDMARSFYYIKAGWVKLFRETLDGAQAVVDILPAGHLFGETAIFDGDVFPYSAEVVEPAEIVSFPLFELKDEINNNKDVALGMLGFMARYRRQQDLELEHRTMQNAPQRIGCFLLRIAPQHDGGAVRIHLPYDKTLVASRLGMQPETFSRALSKLKKETGIRVQGATIEMDSIGQLVKYCCAACSSEFPCKDLESQNVELNG